MRRSTCVAVCVGFVIAIVTPLVAVVSGLADARPIENRPLAARPSLRPSDLLHSQTYVMLNDYLTDRTPWRDKAVRARETVSLSVFDETVSRSVVAGQDGWRYVAETVRRPCWTADQLAAVERDLSDVTRLLPQFRLLLAPDKETAYPQHLQARDRRPSCIASNSAALRRVVAGLTPGYSSVGEAAQTGPALYYRADQHWNDRGALYGAQDLVEDFRPGLFDPRLYRVIPGGELHEDDLKNVEGTPGSEVADRVTIDRPGIAVVATDSSGSRPGALIEREQRAGGPLVEGRVVVVHDSFANNLRHLASPWFADITWFSVIGGTYQASELSRVVRTADAVVLLVEERNFMPRLAELAAVARGR